jgi:oligosaccharyltransferase complex subunit epsilon
MAPKQRNAAAAAAAARSASPAAAAATPAPSSATVTTAPITSTTTPSAPASLKANAAGTVGTGGGAQTWDRIAQNLVAHYAASTPQRTKLLDAFLAFLVAVGGLQFAYCVLAGNYVRLLTLIYSALYSGLPYFGGMDGDRGMGMGGLNN